MRDRDRQEGSDGRGQCSGPGMLRDMRDASRMACRAVAFQIG